MKFKLTLLSIALGICAAAQTSTNVPGVTLTGPANDPTIVNHSGKPLVAALVVCTLADKQPDVYKRLFTHDTLGLADGASERLDASLPRQKLPSPIVAATIKAVILSDGELRGEDSYQDAFGKSIPAGFQSTMEQDMAAMRKLFQMAKAGNWTEIKNEAKSDLQYAGRLMFEHDRLGSEKAVSKMAHWGLLPASTWKGGLLNKLGTIPSIQAIANWFMPMVAYAQSVSYNFVTNWPQGDGTDYWHPTKYNYVCQDFNGSNDPCPGQRGITPDEGIAAVCNASPTYDIGDDVNLTQDYGGSVGLVMQVNASEKQPGGPTWTLVNQGVCKVPVLGFYENFRFEKSCTGSGDNLPVTINDTTGTNVCGATKLGYH